MFDAAYLLRRAAIAVGAYPGRLPFDSDERCSAGRTMAHKAHGFGAFGPPGKVDAGNFRNNLAPFLNPQPVAFVDVEVADYVFVMERRAFDDSARKEHRLEIRHRGYYSESPYLERNEPQGG